MFNTMMNLLEKPSIWQRSEALFWNDEHISKAMLEAHLNPDNDAASRSSQTIDKSVEWLSAVIPAGGKMLDLGCGPGLYTKRLSALGYDVIGMDFSQRSISYAKEHDEKSKYIYEDYLKMDFIDAFDAVTLIYCDYAALTKFERQILLSKVHRALKPNGLFIFDVFSDVYFQKKANHTSWSVHKDGGFWSEKPHICLEATHLYENEMASVDQYIIITNEGIMQHLIWDTDYTAQRLTDELFSAYFQVDGKFDDVCGSQYTGKSEMLCFIASKLIK